MGEGSIVDVGVRVVVGVAVEVFVGEGVDVEIAVGSGVVVGVCTSLSVGADTQLENSNRPKIINERFMYLSTLLTGLVLLGGYPDLKGDAISKG